MQKKRLCYFQYEGTLQQSKIARNISTRAVCYEAARAVISCDVACRPGRLEVVTASDAVYVQYFPGQIHARPHATLHRAEVHLWDRQERINGVKHKHSTMAVMIDCDECDTIDSITRCMYIESIQSLYTYLFQVDASTSDKFISIQPAALHAVHPFGHLLGQPQSGLCAQLAPLQLLHSLSAQ